MFKVNSDMINLLGCSKENFFKLLELMQYKKIKNENKKEEIFVYKPKKIKIKNEKIVKNSKQNNPFSKLSEIRFR
jgi:ATP-dependent RNA helicase SUPV3L1/SUV3